MARGTRRYNAADAGAALRAWEAKRQEERKWPHFSLNVWCRPPKVIVSAKVYTTDSRGKLHVTQVAQAEWHPAGVTERQVVEWGRRAIAAWLEANPEAPEEPQV